MGCLPACHSWALLRHPITKCQSPACLPLLTQRVPAVAHERAARLPQEGLQRAQAPGSQRVGGARGRLCRWGCAAFAPTPCPLSATTPAAACMPTACVAAVAGLHSCPAASTHGRHASRTPDTSSTAIECPAVLSICPCAGGAPAGPSDAAAAGADDRCQRGGPGEGGKRRQLQQEGADDGEAAVQCGPNMSAEVAG